MPSSAARNKIRELLYAGIFIVALSVRAISASSMSSIQGFDDIVLRYTL